MHDNWTTLEVAVLDSPIGSNLKNIEEHVTKILAQMRSTGLFTEFTEHGIDHCREMLRICEWLIPSDVNLNEVEKYLLVLSVYFHDIGMVVSPQEKTDITSGKYVCDLNDPYHLCRFSEFQDEVRSQYGSDTEVTLEDYIRKFHHIRSSRYVSAHWEAIGIDSYLVNVLADLCRSHGVNDLDERQYDNEHPFSYEGKNYHINIQYLAIILRLADLLDATKSRTPEVLLRWLNPQNTISVAEWKRQKAVIAITPRPNYPKIIDFGAVISDPDIFFAMENYATYVLSEIEYCRKLLSNYPIDLASRYMLVVETISLEKVRTIGFEPIKMEISVDKKRVVELFMGDNLYTSPINSTIRELLLNAFDACQTRLLQENPNVYQPRINISLNNTCNTLIIEDNGTGMDDYIINNYLLKVGRSYYSSRDFENLAIPFKPLSKFGIGFLSSFLIADKVEVITSFHKDPSKLATHLEIRDINSHVIVRKPQVRIPYGTKIILNLKIQSVILNQVSDIG